MRNWYFITLAIMGILAGIGIIYLLTTAIRKGISNTPPQSPISSGKLNKKIREQTETIRQQQRQYMDQYRQKLRDYKR